MISPSAEPFNETKYKALSDGLDIEEVLYSNLENSLTIGAEYYGKKYVAAANAVKALNHMSLGGISRVITDGDHGSSEYYDSGVLYLLSESVQKGYIDFSKCRFISQEKNKELRRSELHPGDVVVTKTGVYYGKSAVIPSSVSKANMIAHVGKITLHKGYNPYYVSTFLNCKYGYYQLRRRGIKATRPEIKLVEFPDIIVPIFSDSLDSAIEEVVEKALTLRSAAGECMKLCERLLEAEIGTTGVIASKSNIVTRSLSESFFNTGRLDAEYYQQKYEKYNKLIRSYKNGYSYIKAEFDQVTEKCDRMELEYPYVEIGDIDVSSGAASFNHVSTDLLPANAKIMTQKGDVLVSTVRPNRGAVAILDTDKLLVSGAFTVLRQKGTLKKEVLQVVLRTRLYRDWLLRYNVGTSYPVIKDEDVLNMPIPIIEPRNQNVIVAKVQESIYLRQKSNRLFEVASRAVEMAIEKNEDCAMNWLNGFSSEREA